MNPLFKLTRWYFSKRALPYWFVLILDSLIMLCSFLLVYISNHGLLPTSQEAVPLMETLLIYWACYLIGYRVFHTYLGVIRYSSFVDLQRVVFATLLSLALLFITQILLTSFNCSVLFNWKELLGASLLSLVGMWVMRIFVKYLYDEAYQIKMAERVFIYGVKSGGISLAKSIRNGDPSTYALAGFVSDLTDMSHRMLMGVRVYNNDEHLVGQMRKQHARILLVSPLKNEAIRNNTDMVNRLTEAGIKIYMVPGIQEWDGSSLSHTQLKEVDIEDLLPRDKIQIDMEAVGKLLKGQKIMITGAAGSIGSEMVRQIAIYNPAELILVDQAETPLHDIRLMMKRMFPSIQAFTIIGDISHEERMKEIFEAHRPDYVFHAAAYKHVPMMEDNPSESIQNNVKGTQIIADLAVKYDTKKFVMISTDKAVNPTNVMGCSKRICEIYVQSLDKAIKDGRIAGKTQFVTTRFGNVLGSNGSVIPLFKEQIKNGGPVTVTHPDIIRFFMLIPEACMLVLEAGTIGKGGEIFVFDMGKPVKIVDLAKRMILLSGAKHVEIKFTGLRDGEKLYEEVLNDAEITLPTFHPKIKIAKVREYDYDEVRKEIDTLIQCSLTNDDMNIVKQMKNIVPEFKSQHSKYEVLDKTKQ